MKEYKIICNMYEACGGSFKYAIKPIKNLLTFEYKRKEREEFIEKAEYLLKEDMYYDDVKLFFIDYDKLEIIPIKDISELKSRI